MDKFFWNIFSTSGNIEAYMSYKEQNTISNLDRDNKLEEKNTDIL